VDAQQMSTVDKSAFADAHRRINDKFVYKHDIERWKTPEHWLSTQDMLAMDALGEYEDDCDGHALLVRRECRKVALPTRLVFCWVPQARGYHLGLEYGGWWSCCNHPHIIERERTGYEYISMSGFEKGEDWYYVKDFDHTKPWPHLR
jgi:hypothetical protein